MNQDERNARIEEYGRGFDELTAALAGIPREAWEFVPAPGDWSVHDVLVHMADSETMGALRLRKMIAEPGSTLMPYAEAKWAEALSYRNQNVDDALQTFRLARQTTYRLLKTLTDEVFKQSAVHPEYDRPYTFEDWLKSYAEHVPAHIGQMKTIHKTWKERRK